MTTDKFAKTVAPSSIAAAAEGLKLAQAQNVELRRINNELLRLLEEAYGNATLAQREKLASFSPRSVLPASPTTLQWCNTYCIDGCEIGRPPERRRDRCNRPLDRPLREYSDSAG